MLSNTYSLLPATILIKGEKKKSNGESRDPSTHSSFLHTVERFSFGIIESI